jgi:two-component system alkaline phosphatase synthesis response regulator PhoP
VFSLISRFAEPIGDGVVLGGTAQFKKSVNPRDGGFFNLSNIDYGKILVVEDDAATRETLRVWLTRSGYRVVFAVDGPQGFQAFLTEKPDLMVLDVMLPGMDGLEICRKVREHSAIPVLMLSAQDDLSDKILGLEVGADDYLAKPFHPKELIARIRAQLRRREFEQVSRDSEPDTVSHGALMLDRGSYRATYDGSMVKLTKTEFKILFFLLSNVGATLEREKILVYLWGQDFDGEERTVDSHVRNLRQKLHKAGLPGDFIESVWGVGYRISKDGA